MSRVFWLTFLLPMLLQSVMWHRAGAARVLLLSAMQRSHFSQLMAVGEEMVNRGHEVFVLVREDFILKAEDLGLVTPVTYKRVEPQSETMIEVMAQGFSDLTLDQGFMTKARLYRRVHEKTEEYCREVLMESEDVISQLQSLHLDFVLVDMIPMGACYHLLACRLEVRTATFTFMLEPWNLRLPWLPSYVPNMFLQLSDNQTFTERIKNTLASFAVSVIITYGGPSRTLLDSYSQHCDLAASPSSLLSRSELFLYTSDPTLETVPPVTPNVVLVGGLTAKPANPLPPNLENELIAVQNDIVLVTFGSSLASLRNEFAQQFISAFEEMPHFTFIWRFQNDNNLTLPKNVIARTWLPQGDILGDPRVKAFVSHCGINGVFEAIYHSVPIVALPLAGDQSRNAFMIEHKGYGIKLDTPIFTPEQLKDAVLRVANNATYRDAIKKASAIFRSHPETPRQKAARMLDHVIRYGGSHLRSHAFELNFFQFWLLDVMAFLIVVVSASCYLSCMLCRCVCRSVGNKVKKGKQD